jgi:putative membrane protein
LPAAQCLQAMKKGRVINMTKLLLKYLSIIITIYLLSMVIKTIDINNISALLVMGLVLLIVNILLKPLLLIITLPLNILTLGLFNFIVNAWTIMISDSFVSGIRMGGFLNSLIAALIITIIYHLLKDNNKLSSH